METSIKLMCAGCGMTILTSRTDLDADFVYRVGAEYLCSKCAERESPMPSVLRDMGRLLEQDDPVSIPLWVHWNWDLPGHKMEEHYPVSVGDACSIGKSSFTIPITEYTRGSAFGSKVSWNIRFEYGGRTWWGRHIGKLGKVTKFRPLKEEG